MTKDRTTSKKIDKNTVLAAIKVIQDQGRDLNLYTVADRMHVSVSAMCRNPELVGLILQACGGTTGVDLKTSFNLSSQIQKLEERNAELDGKIKQLECKLSNHSQAALKPNEVIGQSEEKMAQPQAVAQNSQTLPTDTEPDEDTSNLSIIGPGVVKAKEPDQALSYRPANVTPLVLPTLNSISVRRRAIVSPFQDLKAASSKERDLSEPASADQRPVTQSVPPVSTVSTPASSGRFADTYSKIFWSDKRENQPSEADLVFPTELMHAPPTTAIASAVYEPLLPPSIDSEPAVEKPPYSFGTTYSFDVDKKHKLSQLASDTDTGELANLQKEVEDTSDVLSGKTSPAQRACPLHEHGHFQSCTHPGTASIVNEEAPDLEAMDIFDGVEQFAELKDVEMAQSVIRKLFPENPERFTSTISGDELRELVNDRIKQVPEPLAQKAVEAPPPPPDAIEIATKGSKRNKFVGSAKTHDGHLAGMLVSKSVPPEIRKACLILGIRPEEVTDEIIFQMWRRQITSPGVHPDLGGDTESAIFLNTAKDTLLGWLEEKAPKLGKQFGQAAKLRTQPAPLDNADKSDEPS